MTKYKYTHKYVLNAFNKIILNISNININIINK